MTTNLLRADLHERYIGGMPSHQSSSTETSPSQKPPRGERVTLPSSLFLILVFLIILIVFVVGAYRQIMSVMGNGPILQIKRVLVPNTIVTIAVWIPLVRSVVHDYLGNHLADKVLPVGAGVLHGVLVVGLEVDGRFGGS